MKTPSLEVDMYYIKWLLKTFIWLLIIITVVWFGIRFYFWLQSAEPMAQRSDKETRSSVHWLQPDKPLIFQFSPSRTYSLRILSNAIFAQQVAFDKPINYAIEYALFDDGNNLLQRKIYHHASKLALNAEQQQVKQLIENKAALSVSSGQSFYVNKEQLTHASRIALKVIPEDPNLQGVVVRIHAKTPIDNNDVDRAWLKLPTEWRDRTINYHTIGSNAITAQEINNAVTFDWVKLAPQGIPDIDFKADTLYETLPYNVLSYDFGAQQLDLDSFYTDKQLSASFRLYEPGDLTTKLKGDINNTLVTWYDLKQLHAPRQLNYEVLAEPDSYLFRNVAPGLIVISSNRITQSSWFLADNTPISPLHSYYYQIDQNLAANYHVTPNSDISLQFRGAADSEVIVTILNKQKQLITSHRISLVGLQSHFDRIITPDTLRELTTESEQFYLRLPKTAAFLSISSQSQIAAKLQSRQQSFHFQSILCETLCKKELPIFSEIGAWFSQLALNDFTFTEQQRILNVRLFEAPPALEIKPTFYYGRDLLKQLPRSNTALVLNQPKYFEPSPSPKDFNFKVLTDNAELKAPQDMAQLAKARVISFSSTPPRYKEYALQDFTLEKQLHEQAINNTIYTNLGDTRDWVKQRLFYLSKNTSLTLNFERRPESIIIKSYLTHAQNTPLFLHTQLHGKLTESLTQEYTIKQKKYALFQSSSKNALLLHPAQTTLFSYPSVTVPINNDLKRLDKFTIIAPQDMWISILEETSEQQLEAKWWLYETN